MIENKLIIDKTQKSIIEKERGKTDSTIIFHKLRILTVSVSTI